MHLRVLGVCGAWPSAGQACSGFVLEAEGYRLLVDPGYAVLPRLLHHMDATDVDAVLVSHGHPDHCADLNPLLRARVLRDDPAFYLPVYALPGAVDPVLALDRNMTSMRAAWQLHEFDDRDLFDIGPFQVTARLLPHSVPNAGFRITTGRATVAYTGDSGPSPLVVELARDADLLIADASHGARDTDPDPLLGDARTVAREARDAECRRLALTHLLPGIDPCQALSVAAQEFGPEVLVLRPDSTFDLG